MFNYYIDLAWRSLKRNKVLTVLMVLAIALGIGASMTMITVLHVMTADPMPGRSGKLFYPQLDPQGMEGYIKTSDPPDEMTWMDAMNLLHAHRGVRQAAMSGGRVTVVPPQGATHAFMADARYATADFFPMFGVPFVDGSGWTADDDDKHARVAVIARELADKLYGTPHAVGQTLRLGKYDFRVIGVIDRWNPAPHFYDLSMGSYAKPEQVFLPFETAMELKQGIRGSMMCWGDFPADGNMTKANGCAWVQFWVQLDTPVQVASYRDFLINYSAQQKALGRFARPPNVRLRDVMQWLDYNHVVPGSVQLQTLLALGFLLVCLVNTVAMLLVKFLRRGGELSVRRAMGASKRSVFAQLLVEAALVGLAGGVVGLLLAAFGLWVVRQQPVEYAAYAHMDGSMLGATVVLAVCATLLAALFPAWRACRLVPARLLKTQ
ncbi:FtsX-like permease family protein [Rhodanobacter glycinis]|uniref:FtsX-like permease family protein n=1 Tax=Rhodanobacter glycinis TaxID=582702 RepID=A0A5B9E0U9_9GAMM|nr:ABC transporter permease [Rhodanobacter glycinis]QEE25548.1 FtsX-like permease family protein [Rhodanobacter glycinis]